MNAVIELATNVVGLVTAIVGLLAAIVGLRHISNDRKKEKRVSTGDAHVGRRNRAKKIIVVVSTVLALAVSLGIATVRIVPGLFGVPVARQVALTRAFKALDGLRWQTAIEEADRVLDDGAGVALLEQERLERDKVPRPPVGRVSEDVQDAIHARGVLNDVSVAYFIKGRALEHLGKIADARTAYRAAARLEFGRVWDPSGFFWSPADAALGRIQTLPERN